METISEEYEGNEGTGVEPENLDDDGQVIKPWDASKIRVDPKMFSLRQILDLINDGDLDLAPDFQRRNVWKSKQKCRLIESVFLRIPLPAFYFSSSDDGSMQVVDGLQRLSAIRDFASEGGYILQKKDLEYLTNEVGGKRFSELTGTSWVRRFNNTQVIANVIDPQTPDQVKFDIFKRINTGGSPLNAQEIRHCMSGKNSRAFLKLCTDLDSFKSATGGKLTNHVRMVDREVVLRFCAFHDLGVEAYVKLASMDAFLTDATRHIDKNLTKAKRDRLLQRFDAAMRNAYSLFGDHAFRKWQLGSNTITPINRALFEVWSVALATYDLQTIKPYKTTIVQEARKLMTSDASFIDAISTSTGDPRKVCERFKKVHDLVGEIVH